MLYNKGLILIHIYLVQYSNEIDLNVMRTFDVKSETSLQNKTKLSKVEENGKFYFHITDASLI